ERERRRRPLADAVHRQHGGAIERRRVKGARGVAQVMLGEQQLLPPVDVVVEPLELAHEQAFLEQLLLEPYGQRGLERCEAARREREVRLEQALELQERLVVERDAVELLR